MTKILSFIAIILLAIGCERENSIIKNNTPTIVEIDFEKNIYDITIDNSCVLIVKHYPSNLTPPTYVWKSNNTTVATTNSNGSVKAVGVGSAIITATTDTGLYTSCIVNVTQVNDNGDDNNNDDNKNPDDKDPNDNTEDCNVEKAINAISDKSNTTSIEIAGEITTKDMEVFRDIRSRLPKLERVILSDATNIRYGFFTYKYGLYTIHNKWVKQIYAPYVKYIEDNAVNCATDLEEILLPNVTEIGDSAFAGCEKLTSIYFPMLVNCGKGAFSSCRELANIFAPLLEELEVHAFANLPLLKELDLPSVVKIYDQPFGLETNIQTLKLTTNDSISIIGNPFSLYNPQDIDLFLSGPEFDNLNGRIWCNTLWGSIKNTKGEFSDFDYGFGCWGQSKDIIEKYETRLPMPSFAEYGKNEVGYIDLNGDYGVNGIRYKYIFDSNDRLIEGEDDFSFQFTMSINDNKETIEDDPKEIILSLQMYVKILNDLKIKYGEPYYASKDIYGFNDNADGYVNSPNNYYYESIYVMSGKTTITYKFKTENTNIEVVLSNYKRDDKFEDNLFIKSWGFSIISKYTPL